MFFGIGKKKEIVISSPVAGKVKAISSVKDETFSSGVLGPGIAVIPAGGHVSAPADGVLDQMFDTGHAFSMTTGNGVELLVHLGIDTVRLKGKHFSIIKKTGNSVKTGDPLIDFEETAVRSEGYDTTVMMVILNKDHFSSIRFAEEGTVQAGDPLIWLEPGH